METVFSTSEVHVRDRFDYWHDVACRSLVTRRSHIALGFRRPLLWAQWSFWDYSISS